MSDKKPVVVYGASGYTGRLVCEFLRQYQVPFVAAGRNAHRIQEVMDYLPEIDFVMSLFLPKDVDQRIYDRYQMEVMLNHTTKPIVFIGYSARGTELVYEMAAAVAGGMDNLREKPFVILYPEPISPLVFPDEVVDRLARYGWPGNVRELRNAAERYVLLGEQHDWSIDKLMSGSITSEYTSLAKQVEIFEKSLIAQTLASCDGSIKKCMDILSIPRKTLSDKMRKHGLDKDDYK